MRSGFSRAALLLAAIVMTLMPRAAPAQEHAQFLQGLGPRFVVFREKVQDEIKLSAEQKSEVNARAFDFVQETMAFFQGLQDAKPEDRPKKHGEYIQKVNEKLDVLLKKHLKDDQFQRLRQVGLQAEGLFAIGRTDVSKELKITAEQHKQFMEIVQSFQKQIEPLVKQMQAGGDAKEIKPKMQKLREEHNIEIKALLSEDQKAQWKGMTGKPFDLED